MVRGCIAPRVAWLICVSLLSGIGLKRGYGHGARRKSCVRSSPEPCSGIT
jgi:hypothetical protein